MNINRKYYSQLKRNSIPHSLFFLIPLCCLIFSPTALSDTDESLINSLQRRLGELDISNANLQHRVQELEKSIQQQQISDRNPDINSADHIYKKIDNTTADRALERSLIRSGALLLLPGQGEIQPSIAYSHDQTSRPVFINDNGTIIIASEQRRRDVVDANLLLRIGLSHDSQIELGLPYRTVSQQRVTQEDATLIAENSERASGKNSLQLGVAKTVFREQGWLPDIVARINASMVSGNNKDNAENLGIASHNAITGSLTSIHRQDPLVFLAGLSYQHSYEKNSSRPGDSKGLSLGVVLAASPETSLRWVIEHSVIDETTINGNKIPGSNQTAGSFTIGASSIINRNLFVDVATVIGLTESATDYAIVISFTKSFNLPSALR